MNAAPNSKQDFNNEAADKRQGQKMGVPANNNNGDKAPAASSTDSLFASLLIDCFFGAGINQFLGDALHLPESMNNLDIINTVEIVDEFWADRQNSAGAHKKSQENGGFELGNKGMLQGGFNLHSGRQKRADWAWDMDCAHTNSRSMDSEEDQIIRFFSAAPAITGPTGGFSSPAASAPELAM